jgi:uncharacterized protein (TIGR02217 family)
MTLPVFPTLIGLTYPVIRRPVWRTIKQESLSGKRTRLPMRVIPQWQYELPYDMLRSDSVNLEWQTLLGFYNSVLGAAYLFQFNDVDDNAVTTQSFGTGDGTTTQFQLVRSLGGFIEPVYAVNGAPSIFVNGVLKTVTTDYTIGSTGVVTFVVAPGNTLPLTWTGSYYWLARFDDDQEDFSKFMNKFWELKKVTFTTELV